MRDLLFVLAIIAAFLAYASWASGEPDLCGRALVMVTELHDAHAHLADMKALRAQVCAERTKRRECVEQRNEIRAYEAEILELERETLAALRACNASKATRKASAP